jgi:ABC-type lipoprotein export system ATPase subunit
MSARRSGGTGRRAGLKIRFPSGSVGSIPTFGIAQAYSRTMPIVACGRGLVRTFGSGRAAVRVLDGVDLELTAGELVAVVGRSGSGKSTLLHLLGGLDRPDDGTIELDGVRMERAGEGELARLRREKIGFVFQAFHLLPELSGIENVLLPARITRDRGALKRGRALVEQLGLDGAGERLPVVLSGGEQQRLAIARALVNDPLLVLADEPTGNLDPESGATVVELLRQVAQSGKAVLVVTHEQGVVERADRILRLEQGRLV